MKTGREACESQTQPPRVSVHLIPFVLDRELSWADGHGERRSLLGAPLGTDSVFSLLAPRVADLCDADIVVISNVPHGGGYAQKLARAGGMSIRVLRAEELARFLAAREESDYLLVLDSRYWSVVGRQLGSIVARGRGYRGATHALAAGDGWEQTRERADRDREGFVTRVSRLYAKMTWPATASAPVACSLVPAREVQGISFATLSGLRTSLIDRGVFSQDIPIMSGVEDLSRQQDLLALNERVVREALSSAPRDGFFRLGPELLVGAGCRIHPTARLVGPIIVQARAVIGAGSTLIGPAVIGEDSEVGREAVVTQSVLGRGVSVARGAVVSHEVVLRARTCLQEKSSGGSSGRRETIFALNGHGRAAAPRDWSWPRDRRRRLHLAAKRAMDLVLALLAGVILSPVITLAAVLIKATSPGPVLFVHRREGRDGREFPCLKFRTMVCDAHRWQRDLYDRNDVDGPQFKIAGDPRLTRVGRWLRGTNIDELPQLLNVLLGQMSLVGPRPSPFRENQICVPWRRARLSVRPGITGLWQLCRDRGRDGDFHEWIYYDITYVRAFTIWLDLRIMLHTLLTRGGRKRVPLSSLVDTGLVGGSGEGPDVAAARSGGPERTGLEAPISR